MDLKCETDRRTRESSISQQRVETLTSRVAAAEHNSIGGLQAAKINASKQKKLAHKVEKKIDLARVALEDMSKIF